MYKVFKYFKSIKWIFLLKRLGGFAVNYFELIIPIAIFTVVLYVDFYPVYAGDLFANDYGWATFVVGALSFIPFIFSSSYYWGAISSSEIFQFLVVFASYFLLNTFISLFVCNDIGSLPFRLIIVDKFGRRASRWRVVLRTFLKYLTVFLCPILLLLPLFNRRNACLHELISGAYKVEKPKPVYPPMYYPPQQH